MPPSGVADLVGQLAQQMLAGLGLRHDLLVTGDAHVAGGGMQFDDGRTDLHHQCGDTVADSTRVWPLMARATIMFGVTGALG
jgi:hypothetical protein